MDWTDEITVHYETWTDTEKLCFVKGGFLALGVLGNMFGISHDSIVRVSGMIKSKKPRQSLTIREVAHLFGDIIEVICEDLEEEEGG